MDIETAASIVAAFAGGLGAAIMAWLLLAN